MDVLAIKEFISIYQYAVFSQVRAIYDSLVPDESDFGEILVKYKMEEMERNDTKGIFVELLGNSNLVDVIQVLPHFRFIMPLYVEERFVLFGSDDSYNFDIGVDLVNRKVILFDDIEGEYTYIADSEIGFLSYLRIYLEYTIIPNEITNDFGVNKMFKEKVIAAVGGNEYADYYRFVFPTHREPESTLIELPFKL
ncbi:hypothetical protein [[Flexibacter] sp. ATCC 35208]|uniref:hypothetical protein n=1 Tax=[Flexibacter] sp. ATCC 35208 TaxID=1936242 RepID=UPI0009D0CF2B|nr:hypothetical protein [[Flexibacter] sp. ATCC 35208]OMP74903.1 hypothetical protein BW716_32955 [[Flexibacter] sp. ATCC 35208]